MPDMILAQLSEEREFSCGEGEACPGILTLKDGYLRGDREIRVPRQRGLCYPPGLLSTMLSWYRERAAPKIAGVIHSATIARLKRRQFHPFGIS